MGFDWELFFKQLVKKNLVPYGLTFEEFMNKMNGTMSDVVYRMGEKIRTLENELYQQMFNNEHNLSIDQKISDEIFRLKEENEKLSRELERTKLL